MVIHSWDHAFHGSVISAAVDTALTTEGWHFRPLTIASSPMPTGALIGSDIGSGKPILKQLQQGAPPACQT